MLIYNTSFHIDSESLLSVFLQYMRDEYLPRATRGAYLQNPRLLRVLSHTGDTAFVYSLLCETESVVTLKHWKLTEGHSLESDFYDKFGEKILTFSTTMNVVEL